MFGRPQVNQSDGYMWAAKKWLGWGVHGARTTYAHQYYQVLTPAK